MRDGGRSREIQVVDGWRSEMMDWCQLVTGRQEGTVGSQDCGWGSHLFRGLGFLVSAPVVPVFNQEREGRKKRKMDLWLGDVKTESKN